MADDASCHRTRFRVTDIVPRHGSFDRPLDAPFRLRCDRQSRKGDGEDCGPRKIFHREFPLRVRDRKP